MILSALEQHRHSPAVSVLKSGFAYSIDGAVAGIALGIVTTAVYYPYEYSFLAFPFVAFNIATIGAKFGGIVGAIYGLGKGVFNQLQ